MMSVRRLALLIVLVPIVEIVLLVQLGRMVGFLPTLALVVLTGVTGVVLARLEGLRVFFRFQHELARGRLPGRALLDGISVLLGGVLLLAPGVLTDLAGFSLLFPPTRRWIQKRVRKRLEDRIRDGSIRVASMGVEGFTRRGGAAGARGGEPARDDRGGGGAHDGGRGHQGGPAGEDGRVLDPSKGIVVE